MKKLFTTLLTVALGSSLVFAQTKITRATPAPVFKNGKVVAFAKKAPAYTGFEKLSETVSVPASETPGVDYTIGNTYYDLQTNNSVANRIINHPDGRLSGVWTQSQQVSGFTDRGSGYNTSDAAHNWGPILGTPVENIRTGFTSICATADGTEHVFTHSGAGVIQHTSKKKNATTWTQKGIPHQTVPGGLWARSAASGNSLHVIYLSIPSGNGGAIVDGLDGQLLYCRSTDGGATWDKIDIRLPGIDSLKYNRISAEDYGIDANGSNVAIGVFSLNGDKLSITSNDNGATWTSRVVQDFLFDDWWIDTPYDTAYANSLYDSTFHPAVGAIFTGDGSGSIVVDDNGVTHFWYASVFITDTDWTDASYNYYPGYDYGIIYWNSTMDDDSGVSIAYSPDLNADDVWGLTGYDTYNEYGWAFSTMPSGGIDPSGKPYMTYTAHHELDVNDNTASYFRKPFIVRMEGAPDTWSTPVPVISGANADEGLAPFQEVTYSAMATRVDADSAYIIAQVDYTQGTNLNQANTDFCQINYYAFPTNLILTGTQEVRNDIAINMYPNPAAYRTTINFNLDKTVRGNITVMDLNGKVVYRTTTRDFNSGATNITLDVADLATGVYLVQLNTEKFISTQKLLVANK